MKKVRVNSKTKILVGILIIGIIVVGGWWIWKEQAYLEPLERTFPHGLIVASQNGLANLVYNPSNQTYEKQAGIILSGITGIVRYDNHIFVSTENEVLKLDSKFEKLNSKKFGDISAIAIDNKNIFISADSSFIALDKNLEELNRVKLEHNGWQKNAHDILIYKNTAYLLDNIMRPLFLFRVNIENPRNIQITERITFHGINAHLDAQWLNPKLTQWLVLQSYGHRGGSGKVVHIYPMDKDKEILATQEIFSHRRIPEEKEGGLDIRGITDIPPIWAVVEDTEKKYYLAQVSSDDNKISFSNVLDLDSIHPYRKVIIKHNDNYLFIVPKYHSLVIIDVEQQPKIVLSKDLGKFNVRAIIDILPY
ncbi:hypothetical protein ES705_02465 [subsurface metagenome]|nr:hypothetical protein [Clostridia bacterium]